MWYEIKKEKKFQKYDKILKLSLHKPLISKEYYTLSFVGGVPWIYSHRAGPHIMRLARNHARLLDYAN